NRGWPCHVVQMAVLRKCRFPTCIGEHAECEREYQKFLSVITLVHVASPLMPTESWQSRCCRNTRHSKVGCRSSVSPTLQNLWKSYGGPLWVKSRTKNLLRRPFYARKQTLSGVQTRIS